MIPKYIILKDKINEDIVSKKYPLFSKLPTELELAELYNVSRSTVRQALSILESEGIIEKKWGSGNIVVSSSNNSKKTVVALIIPSRKLEGMARTIDDLTVTLFKEGYSVEIFETDNHLSDEREVLSQTLEELYAGYIIVPVSSALPSINVDLYQKVLKCQLPVLFVGAAPFSIQHAAVVHGNDYDCGYSSARYFINQGKTAIGGVFDFHDAASVQRYSGFTDAIRDANHVLFDDIFCFSPDNLEFFLETAEPIAEALFCDSAAVYSNIVDYCRVNHVAIPADLSVICGLPLLSNTHHAISPSTMELTRSLGKEIAHTFAAIKKGGNKTVAIPYKLNLRDST